MSVTPGVLSASLTEANRIFSGPANLNFRSMQEVDFLCFERRSNCSSIIIREDMFQTKTSNEDAKVLLDENDSDVLFSPSMSLCLLVAYTFVFCCCFFGNLLVIVVVCLNRRIRTITNFFLVNLAIADFSVGLFCVYQNISLYLMERWIFGDFLCRMYHFVHGMSYTASILILTAISAERYLAICHPMWSKRHITIGYLRATVCTIWIIAAAYSAPKIMIYGVIRYDSEDQPGELCVMLREMKSYYKLHKLYDLINFIVCFVVPLAIITVLYTFICLRLWRSQAMLLPNKSPSLNGNLKAAHSPQVNLDVQDNLSINQAIPTPPEIQTTCDDESIAEKTGLTSGMSRSPIIKTRQKNNHGSPDHIDIESGRHDRCNSSSAVLRSRRKVIRLLVIVLLCFAVCNLPFHARKLYQNWSASYDGTQLPYVVLTMSTHLILYLNSGINPFLYALFSNNFRRGMRDVLCCNTSRMNSATTATQLARFPSNQRQQSLGRKLNSQDV
ncbi:trissin receptor [Galendromus occidentalis]|uniref:Trissin receptor n=1 Tax=Galendromus occidentalis TaxID=34638 RepID=A0AAJ7SH99_9ACAR|nr:trissin receptor [Galendromus occidentalis]